MEFFLRSEENIVKKIKLPWVSFCTDEDAYLPTGLMTGRHPHPRAYGTFPKVLRKYVREDSILTLEEASYKMSILPASVLGLSNRGVLKKGMAADLVIYDPKKVKDRATYLNPHQYPEGIELEIVNGQIVIQKGQITDRKPGKGLLKNN